MRHQLKTLLFLILCSSPCLSDQTFQEVCKSCHTGGFKGWVSGAPNVKKPEQWLEFLNRDSEEEMRQIVLNGNKQHKKKGGCRKCSNQEIQQALDYLLGMVK